MSTSEVNYTLSFNVKPLEDGKVEITMTKREYQYLDTKQPAGWLTDNPDWSVVITEKVIVTPRAYGGASFNVHITEEMNGFEFIGVQAKLAKK
jgi:hypothetical protein